MYQVSLCLRAVLIAVSLFCLCGCSHTTVPAEGGTAGNLRFGSDVTGDIVVTVHRQSNGQFSTTGFGTTDHDGTFILYKPGATEPLWLEPGDYAFTLESIGPPVRIPAEYAEPKATPLKITWTAEMKSIELQAPQELITP